MTPLQAITILVASLAAGWFAYRLGRATAPGAADIAEQRNLVADLRRTLAISQRNAEEAWEARYAAGYERGRVDQAELETEKRRAAGVKAGATRRNRVTGETRPTPPTLTTTDEGAE